jgi:tetratricopeptide (TPR) repeat protein
MMLGKMKQNSQAIQEFRKALLLAPESAEAYLNLGIALADKSELESALAAFSATVRLAPESAAAHYNRGRVLYELGRHKEAGPELETACRLTPEYPAALTLLARLERRQNRVSRSTELLRKAIAMDPNNSDALALLGHDLLQSGQTKAGVEYLKKSIELNPKNADALYTLFRTIGQTDPSAAAQYRERYLALKESQQLKDRIQALNNFALGHADAGKWDEGLACLKEALKLCNRCAEEAVLHRNLGLIYLRKGDLEGGEKEIRFALEIDPNDSDALKALKAIPDLKQR